MHFWSQFLTDFHIWPTKLKLRTSSTSKKKFGDVLLPVRGRKMAKNMPKIANICIFAKIFLQQFPARLSHKNFEQHFPARNSCKIFLQDFPARNSYKFFPRDFLARFSRRIFPQDFPTRISRNTFPQHFPSTFSQAGSWLVGSPSPYSKC